MKKHFTHWMPRVAAVISGLLAAQLVPIQAQSGEDGVIDLLFLGHDRREGRDYHLSHVFAPVFNESLGRQKIRMRYEEDPGVLNAEDLAKTDVLMLYANFEHLSAQQEKALLDFVEGGGGFIPIHSASACFGHSDAYVDLVGGRFKSHGFETFTAHVVDGMESNPIVDGFTEFETTDETYVHADHNTESRTVLMVRDGEPWTWTRTQGKGRVFYTAYGHDIRTWGQPAFHELLIRGILWSVGEEKRDANRRLAATLPTLKYSPADTIPNYRRQTPAPELAQPFTPEESQALSMTQAGFELKLFAAEPDIVNPVAFAWDERGRLFVIETVDYPNEVRTGEKGDDRIVICEDNDGDGRADTFKVFAEGLNIPTGIMRIDDGWVVSQAPNFLFLKDTDGDDRADVQYVLNDGWGIADTHAGPSNLRYGHDNKIWGSVGYSNVTKSTQGTFGQGVFRMDADTGIVEPVGLFSNNTWGLGISEDFEIFGSTANNAPAWHVPLWRRYTYERHDALASQLSSRIDDFTQFFPITDKYLQVDAHGRYTAGSGFNIYTARSFPKRYWNQGAFIGGPTGHLLGQFFLKEAGSTYVAQNRGSLLASVDEWLAPVFTDVGPDGQLWVADWYNFIIQHNPRPSVESAGFEAVMGKGNAHENPLRDRMHGRIYRIVAKGAAEVPKLDLTNASTAELIDALSNDNLFWRLTAQRKLVREVRREAIPALREIVQTDWSVDELGLNPPVIHAIWSLQGLGLFDATTPDSETTVRAALGHPSGAVRKNAVMALLNDGGEPALRMAASMIDDPDAKTRLNAVIALGLLPPSSETAAALYSRRLEMAKDTWIRRAFSHAVVENETFYLEKLLAGDGQDDATARSFYANVEEMPDYIVLNHHFASATGGYETMLGETGDLSESTASIASLALLEAWKTGLRTPTPGEVEFLQQLVDRSDAEMQMLLKLRSQGLALTFSKVEEESYAGFVAENTFQPNIASWGSLERGRELYAQHCVSCHGGAAHGDAAQEAPALAGTESWYVQTQLQKFHQGIRGTHFKNPRGIAMRGALQFLNSEARPNREIAHIGEYLSKLPETTPPITIDGDAVRGKVSYAVCVACHGENGQGNRELGAPKLTGKQDWYLLKQMQSFHEGVRGADPRDIVGAQMAAFAGLVSDEEAVRDLVRYIQTFNTADPQ